MKRFLLLFVVLLVLVLLPHALFSYRKYNVILITVDTFRSDYSTCYNPAALPTPNIDRLASHGVLFRNAFSLIPLTLPAHSSIMTSRTPHELNVFNNGDVFQRKTALPLLSELLEKQGYRTSAFVSMGVLKGVFGLRPGFQTYGDDFNRSGRWYIVASEVNSLALPWIEKNGNVPFFSWIHYSDPHEPYITVDAPPDTEIFVNGNFNSKVCLAKKERNVIEFSALPGKNKIEFRTIGENGAKGRVTEYVSVAVARPKKGLELALAEGWKLHKSRKSAAYYEGQAVTYLENPGNQPLQVQVSFYGRGKVFQPLDVVRRNYGAEVQFLDKHIGELWEQLEKLGIRKNTILVLTSDHGEALAEHQRVGHGFPLYREVVQVPLILCYPHLGRQGKRVTDFANHLDIMPTILDLLHIRNPGVMRGISLKRYLTWSPIDWLFASRAERSRTFFYTYAPQGKSNSFSVLQDNVKLIQTRAEGGRWKWELYDLKKDPLERKNLVETDFSRSTQVSTLRTLLEEQRREAEEAHSGHQNPELNEDQKRMLRDLGYIAP